MRRRMRLLLLVFVILGLTVLLLCLLLVLYMAFCHEPAFYSKALEGDPAVMQQGSDQMLRKVAALQSAIRKPGRWEFRFTSEEINGWLAVDLAENHPGALPSTMQDPRVSIRPDAMTVACRYQQDGRNSVLSLTIQPYISQSADGPNTLAMRILSVRAGLVPLPFKRVTDSISQAAQDTGLELNWKPFGGKPVAMIAMPEVDNLVVRIETLQLAEGEIILAGITEPIKP